jgi:hypothetical protein
MELEGTILVQGCRTIFRHNVHQSNDEDSTSTSKGEGEGEGLNAAPPLLRL